MRECSSKDDDVIRNNYHLPFSNLFSVTTFVFSVFLLVESCSSSSPSSISRIHFGSCNSQNLTQPLWSVIESRNGSAFIFGGDAIYSDYTIGMDFSSFPKLKPIVSPATPERLNLFYAKQKSNPDYKKFLDRGLPIFAVLDDHDYGVNNGDSTYKYKRESAQALLNFIGESNNSMIRERANRGMGLYGVKVFDFDQSRGSELLSDYEAGLDFDVVSNDEYFSRKTASTSSSRPNKKVAIYLLDSRSNKSPWKPGVFKDFEGDFLGDRQWEWLETAVERSDASVNIIVQGLPVHPHRHLDNDIEDWEKFPVSRQRLYDILLKNNVEAPILISGDVHMAHFMRQDCYDRYSRTVKPLLEITSSGMTHSWRRGFSPQKKFQHGPLAVLFRFATWSVMRLSHELFQYPEVMFSNGSSGEIDIDGKTLPLYGNGGAEGSKLGKQFTLDLNFGELEFDWNNRVLTARVLGRSSKSPPFLSANWTFDQLSGRALMPVPAQSTQYQLDDLLNNFTSSNWQCIHHRGKEGEAWWNFAHIITSIYLSLIVITLFCGPSIISFLTAVYILKYFIQRLSNFNTLSILQQKFNTKEKAV